MTEFGLHLPTPLSPASSQRDGFSQYLQASEILTLSWAHFQRFVGEGVVALRCQAGLEPVGTEV